MAKAFTSGRGSNQYQAKAGGTAPATSHSVRAAVAGACEDTEDIAWAFHPDANAWRAAGVHSREDAQRWIDLDRGVGDAREWAGMMNPHDRAVLDECAANPDLRPVYTAVIDDEDGRQVYAARSMVALQTAVGRWATKHCDERSGYGPADAVTVFVDAGIAFLNVDAHAMPQTAVKGDRVVVLVHTDRAGTYTDTFDSEQSAYEALRTYVYNDWDGSMDGEEHPDDPDDMIGRYFDRIEDGWYGIFTEAWQPD